MTAVCKPRLSRWEKIVNFDGARVVLTGSASGIGYAIAEKHASRGCRVLVSDIDASRAEAAARTIGSGVIPAACNVSDHASVTALAEQCFDELGGVDLVFANAGVSLVRPLLAATPQELEWIFGVNVRGTWNVASIFGKRLRDAGVGGHICITGSEHSLGMQHSGAGLYTSTRHAVVGLADVLRSELPVNIGLRLLCPGLVSTEVYISKRYGPLAEGEVAVIDYFRDVVAHGIDAGTVADATIAGIEWGDFFIVTHPHSVNAAITRHSEILAAFANQAPPGLGSERYEMDRILALVARERGMNDSVSPS